MQQHDFEAMFLAAVQKNQLPIPEKESIQRFYDFVMYLMEVNRTTNLTAIRNIPDVIDRHLIDSLLASSYIPQGARVLDIGCGPGFPSVPLAIARPDLRITALDSTAKKIDFVKTAVSALDLPHFEAVTGRAEDRTLMQRLGQFDVVISRAVARLNILAELCLLYVKQNGVFIALKGAKAKEELTEARNAISVLGGGEPELKLLKLQTASESEERAIILVKKEKATPTQYPRAYASILKKPL